MDRVKREKRYEGEGEGERDMVEWSVGKCFECEPLDHMNGGDEKNLRNLR